MLLSKEKPIVESASASTRLVEGQTVSVRTRGRGNLVSQALPGIWIVAFSEIEGCGYVFESELSPV